MVFYSKTIKTSLLQNGAQKRCSKMYSISTSLAKKVTKKTPQEFLKYV